MSSWCVGQTVYINLYQPTRQARKNPVIPRLIIARNECKVVMNTCLDIVCPEIALLTGVEDRPFYRG